MRIDIYHHWLDEPGTIARLEGLITTLSERIDAMSAELDRLTAAVTAQQGATDSAIALITGLAALIRALPEDRAAIDTLAAQVEAQALALGEAVAANPLP
jgi:ABC-type transporter Mla subunit MlaD